MGSRTRSGSLMASVVGYSTVYLFIVLQLTGEIAVGIERKCEAPIYNDTIPLCLVDSSETLELVGATNGTWSTPSQTSLCQQNVCTLTDLSYNLGGLYTFNSNTGSQRQVNVVIRGPPYITKCIDPADRKCNVFHSRCNQVPVSAKLTFNSIINVTAEGYGAENYSIKWYKDCSSQPIQCSSSIKCNKKIINPQKVNFILKFLTVQTSMAGLYFANISNDRGQQNYSYTQFDVVCQTLDMPLIEKPTDSESDLMLYHGQSASITFEFLFQKEDGLFIYSICLGDSENSDCNDPECSCCSIGDQCDPPAIRPSWIMSLTADDKPMQTSCKYYKIFFDVQIPRVTISDNQTLLSLRFEGNEFAHYNLTVMDPPLNTTKITVGVTLSLGVLILAIVGVALLTIAIFAKRRRGGNHVRLRENSFYKSGDHNDEEPNVTLNINLENQYNNGSQSIKFDASLNYRLSGQSIHLVDDQRNSKHVNI